MSEDNNDDPKNNRKNVPTRAPSPTGTVRVPEKTEFSFVVEEEITPEHFVEIDLSRNDINYEPEINGFKVLLRLNSEPHELGIDGGRISRLTLTTGELGNEDIHAHFDDGEWIEKARTPLEIQTVMKAKKEHNGLEMPDVKPAFDQALEQKPKIKP